MSESTPRDALQPAAATPPAPQAVAAASPPADLSPDFVREAWHEVVSFVETTLLVLARPGTFARRWARGESGAMNPLAYFGVCIALVSGSEVLQHHITGLAERPSSWWLDLVGQNLILGAFIVYGLAVDLWLRRRGVAVSRRATVGVVLYVSGATDLLGVLEDVARVAHWWRTGAGLSDPSFQSRLLLLVGFVKFIWLTRALLSLVTAKANVRSVRVVAEAVLVPLWIGGALVGLTVLLLPVVFLLGKLDGRNTKEWDAKARGALTRPAAQAQWDLAHPKRGATNIWTSAQSREEADAAARRALTRPAAQAEWDRLAKLPPGSAAPKAAAPKAAQAAAAPAPAAPAPLTSPAGAATSPSALLAPSAASARSAEPTASTGQRLADSFVAGFKEGWESPNTRRQGASAPASASAPAPKPAPATAASATAQTVPAAQASPGAR